jgi:3-hydroxybutyrate dehydrogenase
MPQPRIALVTGSTSGIGLAVARALATSGMDVMLNGSRAAAEAEPTRATLAAETGRRVLYRQADMRNPDEIRALVAATEAGLGPVDVLVNNAGVQHVEAIESFSEERWEAILAINLSSAFHATKATFAGMKARRWGRIVNVASVHGLVASPFKAAYVAAKHGLIGLTRTVALEGAEHGVTCNAICPGYVLTPLVEKQIPDQARERGISEQAVVRDVLLAAQATKEFVTVEQLGALAVFLASDAAAQITGAALPVDGGWTAR